MLKKIHIIAALWLVSANVMAQPTPAPNEAPASGESTPDAAESAPQTESTSVDRAREDFVAATELARAGKWNEALAAFERSAKLRPHPVTFYNIGYVERALGHYTRARRALRQSLSQIDTETLPPELVPDARGYLEEVESRIVHVRVNMAKVLPLSVDGRPLEVESNGAGTSLFIAGTREPGPGEAPIVTAFQLLVDPGNHVIVVGSGQGKELIVNRRLDQGVREVRWALPAPADAAPSPAPKPAPSTVSSHPSGLPTWSLVAYGIGAAGLVVGTTFGVLAMSDKAKLEDQCAPDKVCDWEHRDAVDTFNLHADVANVGFAVAVAGAAVGTVFLLSAREESPPKNHQVTWRARVGPSSIGVLGKF